MRHEGGDTVRLDLVGPEGIVGSVTLRRALMPLLAYRLLEAADLGGIAREGSEGAQKVPEGWREYWTGGNGSGHSEAIRAAYEAYRQTVGAEDAMTRDKFKDLFKRKGKKGK